MSDSSISPLIVVGERPWVPLRGDQAAGHAIAFGGGEIDAQRGADAQRRAAFLLQLAHALVQVGADPLRAGGNELVGQPGRKRAGRNRIHVDAELFHLQRQRLGEAHDRGLRRRIGADAGEGIGGAAARQVDDLAVAVRLERLHRLAAAIDEPVQVDRDRLDPLVPVDRLDRPHRPVDAGIVHDDVELSERVAAAANKRVDVRLLRQHRRDARPRATLG